MKSQSTKPFRLRVAGHVLTLGSILTGAWGTHDALAAPDGGTADAATDGPPDDGPGFTSTDLALTVSPNSCGSNEAQYFFDVANDSAASVILANITIKYWVYDTSDQALAAHAWYGGCITSPNGSCVHSVENVTITATQFSPACGPSASQQANFEITVSNTDTTALQPGYTWTNLQTAINLANYGSFTPGPSTWFSTPCGNGDPYETNATFGLYDQGNLVNTLGVTVPVCRAPVDYQIQSWIDQTFYATDDILYSFQTYQNEQVDCIDFFAQHSVQLLLAKGIDIPTVAPPPPPATVPPPNVDPSLAFNGQPGPDGNPEACPAGAVAVSRPTVAQVLAAGGLAAYQSALASIPHPNGGSQSTWEHDCWLNPYYGNNTFATQSEAYFGMYEHAVGIQAQGWLPSSSPGYYGAELQRRPRRDPPGGGMVTQGAGRAGGSRRRDRNPPGR
jgi:hypothetical protein